VLIEHQLDSLEGDERLELHQPQDRTALIGELMKLFTPLANMLGLGGRYLVAGKQGEEDSGGDAASILGLGGQE
jgi:hypothetical protein